MADGQPIAEQPALLGVEPLGPAHTDAERLLWLEFQAVQARLDIHTLTQALTVLTTSVQGVKSRLSLMTGILIGIMAVFKMLPDKSLDVLRHFLAG